MRTLPAAFASAFEPAATRSANDTTSALMKPFSKSVWMTPAACGAFQPLPIVQGSDDEVTPPVNGERLQSTAPERASVKTLPGGHLFPLTHPVETAVIIEEYLDWD